jgi:hypothetical protein
MSPVRSYRGAEDPSPFMGVLKKMSFHAGQMQGVNGGVQRLRQRTPDGEVTLMRVGDLEFVDIATIQKSLVFKFNIMPFWIYEAPSYSVSKLVNGIFVTIKSTSSFKDSVLTVTVPIAPASSAGTAGSPGQEYGEVNSNTKLYLNIGSDNLRKQHFSNYADYLENGWLSPGTYDFYYSYTHYDGVTGSRRLASDGEGYANIFVNNISYFPSSYYESASVYITAVGSNIYPVRLPVGQMGLFTVGDFGIMPSDPMPDDGIYVEFDFSGNPVFYGTDQEKADAQSILNGKISLGTNAGMLLGFTVVGSLACNAKLTLKTNYWPVSYVFLDVGISFLNSDSFMQNTVKPGVIPV